MPDQDWDDVVFPHLVGRIFHATRPTFLKGILRVGKIEATNAKKGFGFNTYARERGYVCFFDFRRSLEDIKDHLWKCHPGGLGREQALLVLSPSHWPLLIPNDQARTEVGYTKRWVPLTELPA
jgi:hypothetical protein